MTCSLTVSDTPDEAVRKSIVVPLVAYNDSQAGPSHYRQLTVAVRDETGAELGGLWGATSYGWLFTQLLAVPESLRGQGLGTRILRLAEQEAIARGCHSAWLDTLAFQARPFYERMGYTCFGELPDYPIGHPRFFMMKRLA